MSQRHLSLCPVALSSLLPSSVRSLAISSLLVVLLVAPRSGHALFIDNKSNADNREQLIQRYRTGPPSPRFELYNMFQRLMGSNFPDRYMDEAAAPTADGGEQERRQDGGEWLPDQLPGLSGLTASGRVAPPSRIHQAVRRAYRPQKNVQDVIHVSFPKNSGWPRLVKRA